jgi:lipoic acid synthetase
VADTAPKLKQLKPKPEWLKVRAPGGENYLKIKSHLAQFNLHTVCEEARCPNIGECWAGGTATFMLLGDTCTRGCKFCAVKTGNPRGVVDEFEPEKIAHTVSGMNLSYIVLTSVDRDDLPDQGASHFAKTVELTKAMRPDMLIEVHGRDSVTINSGGEKIFAEEVEAAVKAHPDVYDCVVTGRPSERWGNEVVAVVRLKAGATTTEESLLDVAQKYIARFKLPKQFVFVETIVRSPAGKADYRWAKQIAIEAAS